MENKILIILLSLTLSVLFSETIASTVHKRNSNTDLELEDSNENEPDYYEDLELVEEGESEESKHNILSKFDSFSTEPPERHPHDLASEFMTHYQKSSLHPLPTVKSIHELDNMTNYAIGAFSNSLCPTGCINGRSGNCVPDTNNLKSTTNCRRTKNNSAISHRYRDFNTIMSFIILIILFTEILRQ